jgi:hypothetical protein
MHPIYNIDAAGPRCSRLGPTPVQDLSRAYALQAAARGDPVLNGSVHVRRLKPDVRVL